MSLASIGRCRVRSALTALEQVDCDLTENPLFVEGTISVDDLEDLADEDVLDDWADNDWLQALRHEAVFFSDPIDLDFAMLHAFPTAYQHANAGGRGPRKAAEAIAEKKRVVLKTNGNPEIYDGDHWDDIFAWYPYLFLSRSKPETHLAALSRIGPENLARRAPPELLALINHVRDILYPEPGED